MNQSEIEERFKGHKLVILTTTPDMTHVRFANPTTSNGYMQITFTNNFNTVIITGDYYDAIYSWGGNNRGAEFFEDLTHSYFMSKCDAWSTRSSKKMIDSDDIVSMVVRALARTEEINKSVDKGEAESLYERYASERDDRDVDTMPFGDLEGLFSCCNTMDDVYREIKSCDELDEVFLNNGYEDIYDISEYGWTSFVHHYAVREVCRLLVESKETANAEILGVVKDVVSNVYKKQSK